MDNLERTLPQTMSLCPVHVDRFYMPDAAEGYGCPMCGEAMIRYVPEANLRGAVEALREIVRHADMPAGESWERSYREVTWIAQVALADASPMTSATKGTRTGRRCSRHSSPGGSRP